MKSISGQISKKLDEAFKAIPAGNEPPLSSALLCASTSATWESQEPLTIEKLKETLASLPKISDPLEEYMIQHGFPPELGGRMWWPDRLKTPWGPFGPPYYVRVTGTVQYPEMFFTEPRTEEPEPETTSA